jgi:hypothetical protein
MIIPDRVVEQLEFVASYVDDCDDWVTVKKEVMRGIPSSLRKNFSTRDPKTKEQQLNKFEKYIIEYWKEKTGINLKLRSLEERRELFGIL